MCLGPDENIYILGAKYNHKKHVALLVTLLYLWELTRVQVFSATTFNIFTVFRNKRVKNIFLLVDQYFSGPALLVTEVRREKTEFEVRHRRRSKEVEEGGGFISSQNRKEENQKRKKETNRCPLRYASYCSNLRDVFSLITYL